LYKSIAATFISKGLVAFINLLILIISSNLMGGEVRGQINLFVLNLSVIHGVNEIYSGYTLVYFIPRFNVRKLYSHGLLWLLFFSILISLLYYLLQVQMQDQFLHLFILSFVLSLHSFNTVFLLAKQKIKQYNGINFLQPFILLAILFVLLFIYKKNTFSSYLIALYGSFIPSLIISTYFVSKIVKKSMEASQPYHFLAILKNGFYNQLASLSHVFSNRFNYYLLGNNMLLGVFGNASSLTESIWLISSSAAPIILTRISNSEDSQNNAAITFSVAKICFLVSVLFSIFLLVLPNGLFIYLLGKDFSHVKWLMLNLCPGILFISFATIISHFYSGRGNQRILVIANVCGFIATLTTSTFLIGRYDLLGACYATNISYFVASIILTYQFMKDHRLSLSELFRINKQSIMDTRGKD
jgi:O-antigen/teichoic acid export membrane protein